MYEFHGDKKRYFDMTYRVTKEHIIPFLEQTMEIKPSMRVLEIGCGEAGGSEGIFGAGLSVHRYRIRGKSN